MTILVVDGKSIRCNLMVRTIDIHLHDAKDTATLPMSQSVHI